MPEIVSPKSANIPAAEPTVRRTFIMDNVHELHARPAALLIRCVSPFRCTVMVQCGEGLADARSLLGLLGLAAGWQSEITFIATGSDATRAIAAIQRLFERRFAEAYQ